MRKMEREEPCPHRPPAEQIHDAVIRILDQVNEDSRRTQMPLLDVEQRENIHDDLIRASVIANYAGPICLYDSPVFAGALVTETVAHRLIQAVLDRQLPPTSPVVMIRYTTRSYAGLLHYLLLRNITIGNFADKQRALLKYADSAIWERDDVPAMHQAYLDLREYASVVDPIADPDWKLPDAAVIVARILFDPGHPQHRPGLAARLQRLRIHWRTEFTGIDIYPSDTVDGLVTRIVDAIERWVETTEERRFGEGSRVARDAVDGLERQQGRLTSECDEWTYEELEHWARWLLTSLSLIELCDVVTRETQLMAFVGSVEFDVPCAELPPEERATLLDVVRRAIRRGTKRHLCNFVFSRTTAPAVERWGGRWHNLDLLLNYLPTEALPLIESEGGTEVESYRILRQPAQGAPSIEMARATADATVETWSSLETSELRGRIAVDLHRQLFRVPPDYGDEHLYLDLERQTLSPSDPPRVLLSALRHTEGEASWCAIVVVRGRLVISLISTNQVTDLTVEGETEVEEEEVGTMLPPHRVLLLPGDLLVINLSERTVVGGALTPIDPDAFYDGLVVRAEEETLWLEYMY